MCHKKNIINVIQVLNISLLNHSNFEHAIGYHIHQFNIERTKKKKGGYKTQKGPQILVWSDSRLLLKNWKVSPNQIEINIYNYLKFYIVNVIWYSFLDKIQCITSLYKTLRTKMINIGKR